MAVSSALFSSSAPKMPTSRFSIRSSSSSISSSPPSTSFDLRSYWTALIVEIDASLDSAIPVRYPARIYEAMRYSVLSKGAKRAPPVMCVATACDLFGLPQPAAFPTACALEMVHAASLIHDDLPCMDDSPRRRGQPSNHTAFGVDLAVLAGDALFPLGFHHIVSRTPSDIVPEPRLLRVVAQIARTVGSTGMAAGQFLDLDPNSTSMTPDRANFVMDKKFGEMGACSAVCGGILAGASDDEIERLRIYGRAVGVLYEMVDDIVSEEKMTGRNRDESRWSYVKAFGREKAMQVVEELREKAKKELRGFERYGDRVLPLYSFLDFAVERGFDVGEVIVEDDDSQEHTSSHL
ncbi:heterodimeric geranylgeranyl pyrophosphate synthase small subunit, chloroplastic [Magnolia sinica]|uniref:heterodimeric geranylgeranyl pyrophosphate synthase small subunit, chloroplastic n=1 Tax=Magnolia sinica TaxID=86752 RepID=UPI002659C1F9|nr:heterodimeric geranylgeranyl pyrophosphate synthase small subunit, chloroplastic [Magnolia sinica]